MTRFLDIPVDKSLSAAGAWTDIDLSGDIPAGATGAIFQVINNADSHQNFGLRKNGSSDDRYGRLRLSAQTFAIIGIDGNQKCEGKIQSVDVNIWLVGYTESDAAFFTNAYDKSLSTTDVWTDIDLSGELPEGAVAAIFEIVNAGSSVERWAGLRKNGSTSGQTEFIYPLSHIFLAVGVDGNRICEGSIGTTDIKFYLLGYLSAGVAETNEIDRSPGSTGSYIDITESNAPTGATGAFVECCSSSNYKSFAARVNGSSFDKYKRVPCRLGGIFVGLDANKKWEGKIEDIWVEFYTLGYFVQGTVEKTSSDAGVGVDAESGVLASLTQSDTGSGIEALSNLMAAVTSAETGTGADAILKSLSSRVEAETGVGVDVLLYLIKGIAKYSSDTGVGVDELSSLLSELIQSDQGVGVEALGSRLFGSLDEGVGVDEVLELALSGSDTGVGSDELKALLATIHGSDTGAGAETQAIDICICLLLKLLQKKRLNIELAQDQKG